MKSVAITDMQGQLLAILPVNDVCCTLNVHNLAPARTSRTWRRKWEWWTGSLWWG